MIETVDWASKVPDLAEREEIARLMALMNDAEEKLNAARWTQGSVQTDEQREAINEIEREYERRLGDLRAWQSSKVSAVLGVTDVSAFERAFDLAEAAYLNSPGSAILVENGQEMRCALSNAPLYDDDSTIEINGHLVLASLFVPDYIVEHLNAMPSPDEEEDEDIEEAA